MSRSLSVYVVSLGCAKNLVDSEVMCGYLLTNGFVLTDSAEEADILLVNTCGFIKDARTESEANIRWALRLKRQSSHKLVVVAGCLVQKFASVIRSKYPDVDLFVGLDDIPKIASLLKDPDARALNMPCADTLPTYLYDHTAPRLLLTPPAFAYVKIAEGCDHRCAYCAIPNIRGRQRSRTSDSVIAECRQVLRQGVREINFIAQDTSRYGVDLTPAVSLEELLRKCDGLEGDFWLRVLYTHPLHLTEGLLDILGNGSHVVPYLDIPLQHIATPILNAMRRGMSGDDTRRLLDNIRTKYPDMCIRTTLLVGFPGETERDFKELLDFVRDFQFDRLGVFTFSPEKGTPAAAIRTGRVPTPLAEARKAAILAEQQKICNAKNRGFIGKTLRVLLEKRLTGTTWLGRTAADAPDVDQFVKVIIENRPRNANPDFVNVTITKAGNYQLTGNALTNDKEAY